MPIFSNPLDSIIQILFGIPENVQPSSYRTYYVTLSGCYLAFLLHFSWSIAFHTLGVAPLWQYNIFSAAFWWACGFLTRRWGRISTAIALSSLEVLVHQGLAVYYLGWDYGFQYFLLAVVPYICLGYLNYLRIAFLLIGCSVLSYGFFYFQVQYWHLPHIVLSDSVQYVFSATNVGFTFFLISVFSLVYGQGALKAESALEQERQKSENLLLNILPASIAQRLKEDQSVIAEHYESTTVLFADIVDFTQLCSTITPTEVVTFLNRIFSQFDDLVQKHGLEKIKTVGDAYMVAGGFPEPRQDHVEAMADLALEMMATLHQLGKETGQILNIRIGIHTGPAIAGVIGIKKFIYDVWGDTVNTASRMESYGLAGKIQVSEQTYAVLKDNYAMEERGLIDIKGKGPMRTYLLMGKKKVSKGMPSYSAFV